MAYILGWTNGQVLNTLSEIYSTAYSVMIFIHVRHQEWSNVQVHKSFSKIACSYSSALSENWEQETLNAQVIGKHHKLYKARVNNQERDQNHNSKIQRLGMEW